MKNITFILCLLVPCIVVFGKKHLLRSGSFECHVEVGNSIKMDYIERGCDDVS
jgi:hypothetical protein